MAYPAERVFAHSVARCATDFMRSSYELNGEPLALQDNGQRWFRQILAREYQVADTSAGLVIGATPWLSALMHSTLRRTTVVDASLLMLDLCAKFVRSKVAFDPDRQLRCERCNWLALPRTTHRFDIVAGDNSFNFLRYPAEWHRVLELLADRISDSGLLLLRTMSIPGAHCRLSPAEIVAQALLECRPVNFTAIRVALLLAHWDPATYTIRPEDALGTFEDHRATFEPLLCGLLNTAENDLLTIEKYRGTGAMYFVAPLEHTIALVDRKFRVQAVHFGPYSLSEYFPLIVASKR
jgi:hypothetical protein